MKTDLLYLLEDVPDADHTADAQADQILRVKLIVDDLCGRKQALDRASPSDTKLCKCAVASHPLCCLLSPG